MGRWRAGGLIWNVGLFNNEKFRLITVRQLICWIYLQIEAQKGISYKMA